MTDEYVETTCKACEGRHQVLGTWGGIQVVGCMLAPRGGFMVPDPKVFS